MKTGKPDFVGFVLWPIVGGVTGWIIVAVCYLQGMVPANPTGEPLLLLVVLGSVLATSTWAGRQQQRCYPTLVALVLLLGLVLYVLAPTVSAIRLDRMKVAFGRDRLLFLLADLSAVGGTLAAIYGLTRWPRVQRAEEEQLQASQFSVLP